MTIIQKMLIVPVLSLFLYSFFIFYSYSEHQQSRTKLAEIRDQYYPLLESINLNHLQYLTLQERLKDAISANEMTWLETVKELEQSIVINLEHLTQYPHIIEQGTLNALKINFLAYAQKSQLLAKNVIQNNQELIDQSDLIQDVENYQTLTTDQFEQLKENIQFKFKQSINDTSRLMDQLLITGSLLSFLLLLFLLLVTLAVSRSTYKSVQAVIFRMKSLALGDTDFSQRLSHNKRDELGYLIHWFNKLSDKLEQDYIKLQTLSITDKLTQLNNRTRTDAYFNQILSNTDQPFAVVLIDIDRFKSVNDTYGHQVGDDVLKTLAEILKATARANDFIARWGGEEFILIFPDSTQETAESQANLVRKAVEQHTFPTVKNVTASFGVTLSQPQDTQKDLIKRADDGLYLAKKQGRNCVVLL